MLQDQSTIPDFVVIIPARDEASTIASVISSALKHGAAEVVVVDDASCDGTENAALQAGATVLPLLVNLGAWGAIQAGFRYALKQGYTLAATMDGDGQHRAEDLPQILKPVTSGRADVCIGSCPERGSQARRLAWSLFRTITGMDIHDFTSGFRAYSQRSMALLLDPMAYNFHHQDMGALLMLFRFGLRIMEIPVSMNPRITGKSRVFSSWLVVAVYMCTTLLLCCSKRRQTISRAEYQEHEP